jgi:glycosyl transferase, family 25
MGKTTVEAAVISLPTATERRRSMAAMLERLSVKWSYFDAHTSLANTDLHYDPSEAKRRFGRTLGAQEIAVYSSHFEVLKQFLARGESDFVLVLEDDIILDTAFPLQEFADFCADKSIDYMRLFGKHFADGVRLGFFYDRAVVRYKSSPAGAQAYLVSRHGARIITEKFRSIIATPDLAMDRFWESQLPLYSLFPYPVIERFSPTSIPIPRAGDELSSSERLVRAFNRVIDKASKIGANLLLKRSDAALRRRLPAFRQVGSAS